MNQLWNSPVVAAAMGIGGTALFSLIAMVARMSTKLNTLGIKVDDMAQDVVEIKSDNNVMRWSDVRVTELLRK